MNIVASMRSMINGMHAVYAIDCGVQLGLFDVLAGCKLPVQINEFVTKTGFHPPYVRSWIRALQAAGVLEVDEQKRVSFGDGWQEALIDRDSCDYIATLPRCHFAVAEIYQHLPNLIRDGAILPWAQFGKSFIRDISADGLRYANFFVKTAASMIPGLYAKLNSGITVYDVGCGGGNFLTKVAKAFPNSTFVGIDLWEDVIDVANELSRKQSGLHNVSFQKMCATEIPEGVADCVILNEVLHEMDVNIRLPALMAIRRALREQGVLFLVDILAPEDDSEYAKESGRMSAIVQFFEAPFGSNLLTYSELENLLTKAGFGKIHHMDSSDNVVAAYVLPR